MLALVPFRDLMTARRFPELFTADLVVRADPWTAIGSSFPLLAWPGRAIYDGRRIRYRVALYDRSQRIHAVTDELRYPVRDLAFHPHDPILAIATGSYDGGYAFNGDLWLWNYQTGASRSLLDDSREVLRCRWEADGRLTILARPDNDHDEDPHTDLYGGTFDVSGTCSISELRRGDHVAFGFGQRDPDEPKVDPLGEPRAVIWDLAWTLDGRLAVARDDGNLELWSTAGRREHVIAHGGRIVQLLRQPDRLLAHVLGARSELYELRGDHLELWLELPGQHLCSVDAAGRILARDVHYPLEGRIRRDQAWSADKQLLLDTDLGRFDAFNHPLRIDGARDLFFLRGTPASSHQDKRLCAIDPAGAVREDLPWDVAPEHRMTPWACLLDDDLVCCFRVHQLDGGGPIRIERRVRPGGHPIWSHTVPAAAIALVAWPAVGGIVAALVDGTLCVIAADGTMLHQERFAIDGIATIPTALATHGETLVVGTIDGRISMQSIR